MKTAELTGEQLDYWVAKAEGFTLVGGEHFGYTPSAPIFHPAERDDHLRDGGPQIFNPSGDWSQGGPIIERERIDWEHRPDWDAPTAPAYIITAECRSTTATGPTPLIAAMRAFVASKFGDTVPDEDKDMLHQLPRRMWRYPNRDNPFGRISPRQQYLVEQSGRRFLARHQEPGDTVIVLLRCEIGEIDGFKIITP